MNDRHSKYGTLLSQNQGQRPVLSLILSHPILSEDGFLCFPVDAPKVSITSPEHWVFRASLFKESGAQPALLDFQQRHSGWILLAHGFTPDLVIWSQEEFAASGTKTWLHTPPPAPTPAPQCSPGHGIRKFFELVKLQVPTQ